MAKNQPAEKQPATTTAKPAAAKQPATSTQGVTLRMLAEKLGVSSEKSLRSRIRRINGGPVVGRGGRYHWDSWKDQDLVALMKKLEGKEEKETANA